MSAHRVVAAIDFGTHGSGFAWAAVNETNRVMTQRDILYFDGWTQQVVYPKNLSALLLDKAGNLLDWGHDAEERMYLEGFPDGRTYHINYKMSLQQNMGTAGTLASTGSPDPARDEVSRLITLCLSQVYKKALEHITAGGIYGEGDIAWCITVPAIWEDFTKDLMLEAARRAGLPKDADRLKIALEPEAAALYCIVKGEQVLTQPGSRFLVIDAGGGTVDITSYQVDHGPRLSQLGVPTGDKAGSEYLNKFFDEDVLCDRFGAGFVNAVRTKYPKEYYELRGAWERNKRGVTAAGTRPITIPLPAKIYNYAVADGAAIEKLRKAQNGLDTSVLIPADEVRRIFEKAVSAIISAVGEQLRRMRRASGRSGGEIALLVGGFAESAYLQARIGEYLKGESVQMHVPPRPSVAVMTGAAHFAYDPSVIRARRSTLTYGQAVLMPFRDGIDPHAKLVRDEDGAAYCNDRFDMTVQIDEAVETDECRRSIAVPLRADYQSILIQVYGTKNTSPTYTSDAGVQFLADLTVHFGSAMGLPKDKRQVEVRMYFGDTVIRVEAENLHTGAVQHTEIKWKPTW